MSAIAAEVTELDHIVVAAQSLDEGRAWAKETLGVAPVGGGKHDGLATHNTLLKLDGKRYLEIIATDPEAGAPNSPRWFGLDTADVRELIAHGPRLVAWVARCAGTPDAIEQLAQTEDYTANVVRPASRADFRWRFAFTTDGARIASGTLPHLIQWDCEIHPCDRLPDSGISLTALMLGAPEPERLASMLEALRFTDAKVQTGQSTGAQLVAMLQTPLGSVVLD
jgi:Glyoxalase-like domain